MILAAAVGSADGVKLAVNIGAMLVAFVALIALLNGFLGWVTGLVGLPSLTLEQIFGTLFAPLMYLISIPWEEAQAAGALFGEKIILNEFIAYSHLNEYLAGMSERTVAIVTFSLFNHDPAANLRYELCDDDDPARPAHSYVAERRIEAGEELTINYGDEYAEWQGWL